MFGISFVPWNFINEDLGLWTSWKDERSFNNLVYLGPVKFLPGSRIWWLLSLDNNR